MFQTVDHYNLSEFNVGDCVIYFKTTDKKPKKTYGIVTIMSDSGFAIHWEGEPSPTIFTFDEFNLGFTCFCKKEHYKCFRYSLRDGK